MVTHTCPICFKEFHKKTHYINHTEHKKKPCKPNISIVNENLQNFAEIDNKFAEINKNLQNFDEISEKSFKSDNFTDKTNNYNLIKNDTIDNIPQHNCNYCYKKFSTIYTLQRHLSNGCKVKKIDDEKKENIFNNLLEKEQKLDLLLNNFEILQQSNKNLQENFIITQNFNNKLQENNNKLQENNKHLQKQIKELENKLKENNKNYDEKIKNVISKNITSNSNNTSNTSNTSNTVNIVNNIIVPSNKLVNFGKEDLSKIKPELILKKLNNPLINGHSLFDEFLKLIHFNPNLPEFQNVYISDINREKFMCFEDNDWKLSETAFNKIIEQLRDLKELNDIEFDDIIDDKSHKYYNAVFKLFREYNKYYEEDEKGKRNTDYISRIDKKLKTTLYNNADKTKENYKKIKDDLIKEKNDKLLKNEVKT